MIEPGDPLPDLGIDVYDSAGVPAAGGAVTVSITLPDQTVVPLAVTAGTTTGQYRAYYIASMVGQHVVTWTVTGANAGVQADIYLVEIFTGIVSLAEAKRHLSIRSSANDETIRDLILQASDLTESAEGTCRIWRRTVITDELHSGWSGGSIGLFQGPVTSVIGVKIDGVATTDFSIGQSGVLNVGGYGGSVKVSYVAGGGPIPAGLRSGVLELIRHLYAMHRGGSGIPRQEEPDYTSGTGYLIPNRVAMAFRAYSATGLA